MLESQKQIASFLSNADTEKIKGQLLNLRSSGESKNHKELVKLLKSEFPAIDEHTLRNIEESPDYLRSLTRRHITRLLSKEGQILDALVEKACDGSAKHIALYYKLTGRMEDVLKIDKTTDNRPSVEEFDDNELELHFAKISENLGS